MMKRTRVSFFSPYATHFFDAGVIDPPPGGAELQLYYMATELARSGGFEVSFVTGGTGDMAGTGEEVEGVRLYRTAAGGGVVVWRALRGFVRLWRLLEAIGPDVVIQRAWGIETFALAVHCRLRGRKFVYMVANDNDLKKGVVPEWLGRGLKERLAWKIFRAGFRLAHLVVLQHEGQAEEYRRLYGRPFAVRRSAHRRRPEGGKIPAKSGFLWVGRCERLKRPELFLELARRHPALDFKMICPGGSDGEYSRRIAEEASRAGNVTYLGFVPFRHVEDHFAGAAWFVDTSLSEGFPNTFVQAVKYGTPILSLKTNPAGVVERERIGRAFDDSFEAMAAALPVVSGDEERWTGMSARALRYFSEHHDISRIAAADREMIRRVLGGEESSGDGP